MPRVISQETFDETVRENIEDFQLDVEEAIQDAVKQFEAQGVDLTNIVKDVSLYKNEDPVTIQAINKLDSIRKEKGSAATEDVVSELVALRNECRQGIAHKVFAGKNGAYKVLVSLIGDFRENDQIVKEAVSTLCILMSGQPDLLDSDGISLIINLLQQTDKQDVLQKALRWVRECCIKHEANREHLVESGLVERLKFLLEMNDTPGPVVQDVCNVFQVLVLDDDIRVPFGKAHERAKFIASDSKCLLILTDLLKKFQEDKETLSLLLSAISSLCVRHEYCQEVFEAGGLKTVMDILMTFSESEALCRQCMKFIRVLGGHDNIKIEIIKSGSAPLLMSVIRRHQSSGPLLVHGFGAIASLSLRSPSNSYEICEAGAAETIIQGMKIHKNDVNVQKHAALAIRNLVARSKDLTDQFLSQGVEDLLRTAMKTHGAACDDHVKAALRDLGCKVEFRELWTGKGGALN